MTRRYDDLPTEFARELRETIERDKNAAMAKFDTAAFAHHVRRRIAADGSLRNDLRGRHLPHHLRPGTVAAAAMAAIAIAAAALVVWIAPSRGPRTDPKMIARMLAGCEFFGSVSLDQSPVSVAGRSLPAPGRDLEWSIQALLYRARRGYDGARPAEGDVARAILAALEGSRPAAPAPWPHVDPDALARRIAILSRKGAFLRALGNMQ